MFQRRTLRSLRCAWFACALVWLCAERVLTAIAEDAGAGAESQGGKERTAREDGHVPTCKELARFAKKGLAPSSFIPPPEKFWAAYERCYAPGGDACEQGWADLLAVPAMATPTRDDLEQDRREFLRACRSLPLAQRRCARISFALVHPESCPAGEFWKTVRAAMRRARDGASRP